jgi:hypothetical protein
MKRIGLSFALPALGLFLGVATPATASAQGWHGGGHVAVPAGGGWRGGVVTRPAVVPHVAVAPRVYVGRPGYLGHPGYVGRPGYVGHPAYDYGVGPVAGHWGWHGGSRVWFGVATTQPYPGWSWAPGAWVWDGYQWVWQDGYWAPPAY